VLQFHKTGLPGPTQKAALQQFVEIDPVGRAVLLAGAKRKRREF
jgi:hypothetical protein